MGNIYIEDITTSLPNFKCKQCNIILFLTNTILSNIINFGSLNKIYITNGSFNVYNLDNMYELKINKMRYMCNSLICRKCNCIVGYKILECKNEKQYNNCFIFLNSYISKN